MTVSLAASIRQRDQWVTSLRPARNPLDTDSPYAFMVEDERAEDGNVVPVATVFLTNRECPWRCVMCDLWRNTLPETVQVGAIPRQIDFALGQLPPARQIKLYNSGSFFDVRAIPAEDYDPIAARVGSFERIILECHPALVGKACAEFQARLAGDLEVAMGLETAHPAALEKLNKRMTLDQFAAAARFLRENGIAIRVFLLVGVPFIAVSEQEQWLRQSIDFAFDCGATAVSLIPTRSGNGAMEVLLAEGQFSPPALAELESAVAYGIGARRGRVFADLWDLEKFSSCPHCLAARKARLQQMNLSQTVTGTVHCSYCKN